MKSVQRLEKKIGREISQTGNRKTGLRNTEREGEQIQINK